MVQDIYDPLDEYASVFKNKFKEVAEDTFESLTKEANIDVEMNKKTCALLYSMQEDLDALKKRLTWWNVWCSLDSCGSMYYSICDRF